MTVQVHGCTIVMFLSLSLILMANAVAWLGGLDVVDAEVETSSFRACPVRLLGSVEGQSSLCNRRSLSRFVFC